MRVLHLVKTSHGARWALRQIEVLQRLGAEVVVALPDARGGLAPEYRRAGAFVVEADLDFTAREPWRLRGALRRCRELVDATAPDLIHSHFVSTTLVTRLALGRAHPIPRVFQVPGPLHLEHAGFARLDRLTAGPSDYWIGSCRWTCERYRQLGVPSQRVFLSYYGTEPARLRGVPHGEFRGGLGFGRDATLVGLVAYLYPPKRYLGQTRGLKGHEDFIDAVATTAALAPSLRGVIVGGTWGASTAYEQRLRRRAAGAPITFTGLRDDVPSVYADLQVAVHPSLSENCGGAVESLAAGVPTIATNVGGLPDVVVDGDTGWLVPPRDPVQLSSTLLDVLRHPLEARRRARRGQELVGRLFDVQRTAREVAHVYRQILRREPRPLREAAAG